MSAPGLQETMPQIPDTMPVEGRSDVYLRRIDAADDKAFYEMILHAGENMDRFQFWDKNFSLETERAETKRSLDEIEKGHMLRYRIIEQETAAIIGEVSFYDHDTETKTASLGYLITAAFEGKGVTRAAAEQLIGYGTGLWELDKIVLEIEVGNVRSEALAEQLSAKLTGVTKLADRDTRTMQIWEIIV